MALWDSREVVSEELNILSTSDETRNLLFLRFRSIQDQFSCLKEAELSGSTEFEMKQRPRTVTGLRLEEWLAGWVAPLPPHLIPDPRVCLSLQIKTSRRIGSDSGLVEVKHRFRLNLLYFHPKKSCSTFESQELKLKKTSKAKFLKIWSFESR